MSRRALLAVLVAVPMALAGCGSRVPVEQLERANGALSTASDNRPDGARTVTEAAAAEAPGETGGGVSAQAAPNAAPRVTPSGQGTAVGPQSRTGLSPTGSTGGQQAPGTAAAGTASQAGSAKAAPAVAEAPSTPGGPTGQKAEVLFGSLGAEAGVLGAVSGPAPPAIRAWVAHVNASGGLAGHPVRVIMADSGGDPTRALAIARRFVEQDHVIAIFSPYMFSDESVVVKYLEEKGVPQIGTIGADPASQYSAIAFNALTAADTGMSWAIPLGIGTFSDKKKIALVYCREVAGCKNQADGVKKVLPEAGFTVVYEAGVSLAQPDYTAEVISAKNAGAEIVFGVIDSSAIIRFNNAANRQNWKPVLSGFHNFAQDLLVRQADKVQGFIIASRSAPYQTSPRLQFYRDAMARYQPNAPLGDLGAGVFIHGALLEKVAPLWPDQVTPGDIIKSLYSLQGETLGGLLPGITFHEGQHTNTNMCSVPSIIEGDKLISKGRQDAFVCLPSWKPGS
jgi:branched-chain amino acid transport system substrate-binding protein